MNNGVSKPEYGVDISYLGFFFVYRIEKVLKAKNI